MISRRVTKLVFSSTLRCEKVVEFLAELTTLGKAQKVREDEVVKFAVDFVTHPRKTSTLLYFPNNDVLIHIYIVDSIVYVEISFTRLDTSLDLVKSIVDVLRRLEFNLVETQVSITYTRYRK